MPQTITCPGCQAPLRVREELAGKKVKCPRCAKLVPVPTSDALTTQARPRADDEVSEVEPLDREGGRAETRRCPSCGKRIPADARKCRFCKERVEEVEEDEGEGRRGKRSKYKPCPRCGARGAERVLWTFWGSFYGPKLFTHVRCPECGYGYNGKTGGSNLIPAIIFFTVPLLGVLALIGAIIYMVYTRLNPA